MQIIHKRFAGLKVLRTANGRVEGFATFILSLSTAKTTEPMYVHGSFLFMYAKFSNAGIDVSIASAETFDIAVESWYA